jgi:hypothetical protein
VGRALTSSLVGWMIGWAYLILRRYGGPGSDKLAAGVALFGAVNVPFIFISVNYWRTIHPPTTVVPRSGVDGAAALVLRVRVPPPVHIAHDNATAPRRSAHAPGCLVCCAR